MFYGFEDWNDVIKCFAVKDSSNYYNAVPLFACYNTEDYEGTALVIFIHCGKFWLVSGSHCSCYGLENQWEPEETPLEVLMHFATKGDYSLRGYEEEFTKLVDFLKSNNLDELEPRELQFLLTLYYS